MSIALSLLWRICIKLIIAGIQMALFWINGLPSKIIDYLLVDAWDIENSLDLQSTLWKDRAEGLAPGDIDLSIQVSRRLSALGQIIEADLIHGIVRENPSSILSSKELNYNDMCKFFINQGANIECRDTFRMETALLVTAELDNFESLKMMLALLWLNADLSAVDYKGRGPLHLALKPSRLYGGGQRLHSRALKDKLVHLLQAGCSIHAIDHYGWTPTDVARKWRRTKAWEAALQELGKLECERSECKCEIIVRLSPGLRFPYSVLALAVPTAIDAKLTIAKDRTFRV